MIDTGEQFITVVLLIASVCIFGYTIFMHIRMYMMNEKQINRTNKFIERSKRYKLLCKARDVSLSMKSDEYKVLQKLNMHVIVPDDETFDPAVFMKDQVAKLRSQHGSEFLKEIARLKSEYLENDIEYIPNVYTSSDYAYMSKGFEKNYTSYKKYVKLENEHDLNIISSMPLSTVFMLVYGFSSTNDRFVETLDSRIDVPKNHYSKVFTVFDIEKMLEAEI